MVTTIQLNEDIKKRLEALKVHKREPFNDVIDRLLANVSQKLISNDLETLKRMAIPILKANGVKKAAVFGSFARGDANENSDVDLLVKYEGGTSLFDVVDLKNQLEAALGREVDLVSYDFIDKYIKERVLRERVPLYE